jgi:hypothetical protein
MMSIENCSMFSDLATQVEYFGLCPAIGWKTIVQLAALQAL